MIRLFLIFLIFLISSVLSVSAFDAQTLDIRLQKNLEEVETKLESRSLYRKVYIYTNLVSYINSYIQDNTISEDKKYLLSQASQQLEIKIQKLENTIQLSEKFSKHDTLSLIFNNTNIQQVISENSLNISEAQSIFIFRDSQNLSRNSIKNIVSEIKKLNSNILIFIDQEWGQINRYWDFDSEYTRDDILEDAYIQLRKQQLTAAEYNLFLSLFPIWSTYFPSVFQVWSLYDSFPKESAKIMLEMFAYMRLKSHSDIWINTYGLVTDLSRGNPSITPLGRSFSKHSSKYKILLDAFAIASRETWVLVYLKHFPWVWLWAIDSHNGVLDLRNYTQALTENMELFAYANQAFWDFPLWVMLWHVIIPNILKQRFTAIAKSFDFMITDDLWMQGYSQATWKTFQNWFFSIDELKNSQHLITLDRKSSFYVK